MGKKYKIPIPTLPNNPSGRKILDINKPKDEKRAVIGITYLNFAKNDYDMKALAETHKKQKGERNVFGELESFIGKVNEEKMSIEELIELFHSRYKLKSNDKVSQEIVSLLREKGIDASDFVHLHCKANGKGKFVLHGFILDNVFEIVLFDPDHKLHN